MVPRARDASTEMRFGTGEGVASVDRAGNDVRAMDRAVRAAHVADRPTGGERDGQVEGRGLVVPREKVSHRA